MLKFAPESIVKPLILLWMAAFLFLLSSFERQTTKPNKVLSLACPLPIANEEVIERMAYTFAYNEAHEQANWVAYMLTSTNLGSGVERSNRFMEDPLVSTQTATNADYAKSGYDRGHLAPAADVSWSLQAMQESFYYSNMSPQLPGFNRGIWKKLEEKVRAWALQYDTLYIVTGPILEPGLPTIGPNKVSIPKAYFKALYAPQQQKGLAFILPNAKSEQLLSAFCMSIDALELKLNRDFFYQELDQTERVIEAQAQFWP